MLCALIRHRSLVLVWLNDSNSVSPDSSVNVSSPVSFDSPVDGADMEEMVRLLVFPVGMMISRIHLALILSLLCSTLMLSKVLGMLNKI